MKNCSELQRKLDEWRTTGREPTVDPHTMYEDLYPRPEVRAVLMLARAMASDDVSISWDHQVAAAKYYNEHGLAATLDEVVRLGGQL